MPINKRESLIFTSIMCAFMVYVMTLYNVTRVHGFSIDIFESAWLGFPMAYVIAMMADCFIVGPQAKKLAFGLLNQQSPTWKKVITISFFMVSGMVIIMSLFGAIHAVGFSSKTAIVWLYNIPTNFVLALPLQLLIAGPLVRFVFRAAFPEGVIRS